MKYELVSTLRTLRSFLFVVGFVGVLLVVALFSWPVGNLNPLEASSASWNFVRAVTWTLFWVCLLFVPAYAAGAIVGEKDRGSFDMLRMTLIQTSGIIAGKFTNAVGFFLLLFIALLPIFATVLFLIGVDAAEIARAYLLIFAMASACAMVGIMSSTMLDNAFAAIAGAYVGVLGLMLGPALVVLFVMLFMGLFAPQGWVGQALEFSAQVGCPFYTLNAIVNGGIHPFIFVLSMVYHAVFIGICYFITLKTLQRPPRPVRVPSWKPIDSEQMLKRRRDQWPYYLIDPMRRKKPIEDGRNTMLVRELRYGLISRGTIWIRVFYGAFFAYFMLGVAVTFERTSFEDTRVWLMAQILVTVAVTPALVANALTKEYELGNIDMLRMTLLQPRDIVLGKGLAGLMAMVPMVGAACASAIPLVMWGMRDWTVMAMGYVTLINCAVVSLSLGLAASLVARRTTSALIISYVLNIIVFGGISYVAQLMFSNPDTALNAVRGVQSSTLPADIGIIVLSPIRAFYQLARYSSDSGSPPTAWALSMVLFGLLGIGLTWGALAGFARYRMRDV